MGDMPQRSKRAKHYSHHDSNFCRCHVQTRYNRVLCEADSTLFDTRKKIDPWTTTWVHKITLRNGKWGAGKQMPPWPQTHDRDRVSFNTSEILILSLQKYFIWRSTAELSPKEKKKRPEYWWVIKIGSWKLMAREKVTSRIDPIRP